MTLRRRLRGLAIGVILLPLLALVFWLTALIASNLPGLEVLSVNVHGLNVTGYAGDPGQRPAPLSLSVLSDAGQDASGALPTPTSTPSRPAPSPTAVAKPLPAPTPTPTPSPTPTPLPLPTVLPVVTATPIPPSATISGQVIDSVTHSPIVGASVSLSPGGQVTATDVNGNYSLAVNPGTYTVTASAVGYSSASQTVGVNAGQNQNVNFKLASLLGSIKGTVTSSTAAAPIAGAAVTLSNGLAAVTDLSGNYSFAAVLSGNYSITASAVGFASQTQPVTVRPGHETTVDFQLAP